MTLVVGTMTYHDSMSAMMVLKFSGNHQHLDFQNLLSFAVEEWR